MAVYFLDSSALVKRYINETGSAWVVRLFDPTLDEEFNLAAVNEGLLIENPNHHP